MPIIVKSASPVWERDNHWSSLLLGEIGGVYVRHRHMKEMSTNLHMHPGAEETFFVLDGYMTLEVDGKRSLLSKGDLAVVSAGEKHRLIIDHHVELLVIDNIQPTKM
ncbi:cupin domain-containing protein [Acidihalobacter prosperus]|uniref:cupin domain-containing protein n=1 Tax=Acidihalobacter prosperus TaxID=160660 RepID=UPI000506B2D0|nr:cupin domain-containing protein [Acidihalobacter prosperus]